MKFVALLSGGKDSCYNVMKCQERGHDLVCLANLLPQRPDEQDEINSFMYQTAAHTAIPAQAECFGVPLYRREISGKALCQTLHYTGSVDNQDQPVRDVESVDEVEDLYLLLKDVLQRHPDVKGVSCGAILSTYQRFRVEDVCARLNLTLLSYLWQRERAQLLDEMLAAGVIAILVKVAGAGLEPQRHLGRDLSFLRPSLQTLHERYGLDLCGEGGEYETLVLDCPSFSRRLVIDRAEVVLDEEDASVGNYRVWSCHSELKTAPEEGSLQVVMHNKTLKLALDNSQQVIKEIEAPSSSALGPSGPTQSLSAEYFDVSFSVGKDGLAQTALVLPSTPHDSSTASAAGASQQMREIMGRLSATLTSSSSSGMQSRALSDAVFIHLFVADMALFAAVNEAYCTFFGDNPPSRSCVQLPLPAGVLVAADCLVLLDSHNAPALRETLHVRSISEWAPMCIGPYAQANTLCDHVVLVAGQIPLDPGSMAVYESVGPNLETLLVHLSICLQHAANVLLATDSTLSRAFQCVVYVNMGLNSNLQLSPSDLETIATCTRMLLSKSWEGLHASAAEGPHKASGDDDDDDDDCDRDSDNDNDDGDGVSSGGKRLSEQVDSRAWPVIVVGVTGIPRDCLVEVEVAAVTLRVRRSELTAKSAVFDHHPGTSAASVDEDVDTLMQAWPIWNARCVEGRPRILPPAPEIRCRVDFISRSRTLCAGAVEALLCPSIPHTVSAIVLSIKQALLVSGMTRHSLRTLRVLMPATLRQPQSELATAFASALSLHLALHHFPVIFLPVVVATLGSKIVGQPPASLVVVHFTAIDLLQQQTESWIAQR